MGRVLKPTLTPRQEDRAIALFGLLGGLVLIAFRAYDSEGVPRWAAALPLVAIAVLELFRRTRPVLTVCAGGAVFAACIATGSVIATIIMYTDLLYAAVVYGSRRMSGILHLTGAGSVILVSSLVYVYSGSVSATLVVVVTGSLVFLTPVWSGDLVRKHREEAEAERLRAQQTALLAELDRRGAVVAERARMARELHDVIANHLSAIAIHATGAQSLARRRQRPEDDPLVEAIGVIRENSVQGLAEMRRMIGLLRDSGGGEATESYAAPRLDALESLVAQARAAGRDGGLAFEAAEVGERGELPAPLELAAYRIVQESLTNAVKHAAPGTVRLDIGYRLRELEITVDSPYRPGEGQGLPGARAGLVGMGERAELLGGSFRAGPEDGRWRVRAVLPRETKGGDG
ncbi:sensor histidine kinase [Kitasatospora camelliae]|uniref:histidine kinase n=1 Tax=Kitasatospora camelliae TaxID=3156397 RepID=A0AAU8K285_9ACTN